MIEIQREVAVKEGHGEPFNEDEEDMIKVGHGLTKRIAVDRRSTPRPLSSPFLLCSLASSSSSLPARTPRAH